MEKNKSSISQASSDEEIGEFWDNHDLGDFWDQTEPAEFKINLQSHKAYFAIDAVLNKKLDAVARARGISAETLLNLWLQEKLQEAQQQPVYQVTEK